MDEHPGLQARVKAQLRRRMRATRSALPESSRARRSSAITAALMDLPMLEQARAVALFWPMQGMGEVDCRALDARLREAGKAVYYPIMSRQDGVVRTGFRQVGDPRTMVLGAFGFREPNPDGAIATPGSLDVVVVPALAVAPTGHRLGYGVGFYDSVLAEFRPPAAAIAVAFDFQVLVELPVEPHDIACDMVVTDLRVIGPHAGELVAQDGDGL